jgi:uncharacterized protein with HEPN domain
MQPKIKTFLYDIQQACQSLDDFTADKTFADYQRDELLRSGVERKLMIIGEAVYQILHLDPDLESNISQARQIIGFRNVLVHGYFAVEDETVWGIVKNELPALAAEISRILEDRK